MIEIIHEYVVKEDCQGHFELLYGPGGAWSRLFAHSPGFRGLSLLRDTKDRHRFLTIELWETESQREQALADQAAEYSRLEAAFREWVEFRAKIGSFRVLAEATIRPRGRTG
ncbi:MAG: hypothetical protein ANABAC_2873 [Anaerolineae bacterium]|nr:MAG: hypothetical protein ANABAC_2873 [Anaerolineae bacterium]